MASDPWGDVPPRPNKRPQNPWGPPPEGSPRPPELDELIARLRKAVERFLPGASGRPGSGSIFGGGSGGGKGGGPGGGPGGGFSVPGQIGPRGLALIGGGVLALWLVTGFYRVQPDQEGVVMRFGAFNRIEVSGLNYHLPWPIETVRRPAVTRINRVDIGYRSGAPEQPGAAGDISAESLMLTGDENIIDINAAVFWRIRDAKAFLFATRNPDVTVKSAAESVMREVIGRTPIQPALTDARARIEAAVAEGVQAILDQYGTGVEITQVQLQRVDPPAAVIESFRDVQRANTDADRMRNEAESYHNDIVPRARGDAARITAEADATRQANIVEATGQAQRFLSVLAAYRAAKNVTVQRLYIETMQEILAKVPTVVVDAGMQGVVPYLPLGDANRAPVPAPGTTTAPPQTSLPPMPAANLRGTAP
jgi:membrane protease subunit HflK